MIKKSFIVFALVLIAHIIIRDVIKPDIEITQAPWQANQQIGQRYLYSTDKIDDIAVGSSLSFHLDFAGVKDSITNLSFSGESPFKGIDLAIIKGRMTGLYPKRIFIEINTLDNYGKSTFEETIYNPFLIYPRKYIPSLRDGKQPLVWTATIFQKHITHYFIPNRYYLFEDILRTESTLEEVKEQMEEFVPNERLNIIELGKEAEAEIEKKLTRDLEILIDNGCTPVFFEVPVSEKHRTSPKYASLRAIIERNYPATKYNYIGYSLDSNYQTYDGLHLTYLDSPRYSSYLRAAIDSISCPQKTKE